MNSMYMYTHIYAWTGMQTPHPLVVSEVDKQTTGAAHPHREQAQSWLVGWTNNKQLIGPLRLSKIKSRGVSWQQHEQNTAPLM